MNYYALQIKTGDENKFLTLAQASRAAEPLSVLYPRRALTLRRLGKSRQVEVPLFPGYIFLKGEELPTETYWRIKKVPGFYRFLKSNLDIRPLEGRDRELLLHFLSFGEVVRKSRVRFDENSRIQVIEGPLKGLEGRIVKVNRRKGRAKVKLDLYEEAFLVDLGIEILEEAQGERRT